MNRRSFFGSVIGLVAGSNFLAKRLIESPQKVLLPYKVMFGETRLDEWVQCPGVMKIEKTARGFKVICEDFHPTVTLNVDRLKLYTLNNIPIQESRFDTEIGLCNGDILKAQLELTVDKNFNNFDELVKVYLREKKLNGVS